MVTSKSIRLDRLHSAVEQWSLHHPGRVSELRVIPSHIGEDHRVYGYAVSTLATTIQEIEALADQMTDPPSFTPVPAGEEFNASISQAMAATNQALDLYLIARKKELATIQDAAHVTLAYASIATSLAGLEQAEQLKRMADALHASANGMNIAELINYGLDK